jgi:hypothetical protein
VPVVVVLPLLSVSFSRRVLHPTAAALLLKVAASYSVLPILSLLLLLHLRLGASWGLSIYVVRSGGEPFALRYQPGLLTL